MGASLMLRHQKRVARRTNAPHDTALLQFRKRFAHPNQALRDTTALLRHRKRATRQTNLPQHLNRSTWQTDINRSNSLVPRPKKNRTSNDRTTLKFATSSAKKNQISNERAVRQPLVSASKKIHATSDRTTLQSTVSVSKKSRISSKCTVRHPAASASKKIQPSSERAMLQPAASTSKPSRADDNSDSAKTAKSMLKKPRRYNLVDARKLCRFRQSNVKFQQKPKQETFSELFFFVVRHTGKYRR